MIEGFGRTNDYRLLVPDFTSDDRLALEDGFDRKFAVLFEG